MVVPADSVTRVPGPETSLEEAATLPMNGLTVRRALDLLALQPGQTLAVTGAAGAVGGYSVQLGVADGLRVVAVASPEDEPLMRSLGASVFVPRGEAVAQAIRAAVPEGVDGLIDAAVIGRDVLAAIRDGGAYAGVRGFEGETERGISIHRVAVSDYARNRSALDALAGLVSAGKLTLRVAETFPPDRAADAHRKLEAGGVRGPAGDRLLSACARMPSVLESEPCELTDPRPDAARDPSSCLLRIADLGPGERP